MSWEADTEVTGIRDAHFMLVGTRPSWRRQGVASALIAHALRAASSLGYDPASVQVDEAGLFEKAGFTARMRYVRWALETT